MVLNYNFNCHYSIQFSTVLNCTYTYGVVLNFTASYGVVRCRSVTYCLILCRTTQYDTVRLNRSTDVRSYGVVDSCSG